MRLVPLMSLALCACNAGYLSTTRMERPENQDDTHSPAPDDLLSSWTGSCHVSEVSYPATPEAEEGIEVTVALQVSSLEQDCSTVLGQDETCYKVIAPSVHADWPGSGEGQLRPDGSGPIDVLVQAETDHFCDSYPHQDCDPAWELYLWGDLQGDTLSGDCQTISSGTDGLYPVTWGTGAFELTRAD